MGDILESYITEKVLETISYYNDGTWILFVTTDNATNMDVPFVKYFSLNIAILILNMFTV